MAALPKTLEIEQGATFTLGFVYTVPVLDEDGNPVLDEDGKPIKAPKPLDGCTARMQIRAKVNSDDILVLANTGEDVDAGGQRIVIQAEGEDGNPMIGRIDIVLTDLDTMQLAVKKARYDLELEWPLVAGDIRPRVERLLKGEVLVDPNVTREVL